MYKSGSILVYQVPQQLAYSGQNCSGTGKNTNNAADTTVSISARAATTSYLVLPVPLDAEEATSLPSSKQWDAKHGLYVVPRLTEFDSEFNFEGTGPNALANPFYMAPSGITGGSFST